MARKYGHSKILSDADKALGGKLPPVLAGPPSWVPPGYVCTPADVQVFEVPGHRRATARDVADYCAAWNRERAEQAARPRPAPAPVAQPATSVRSERSEDAHAYVERALRETKPRALPEDTPTAFFDERGEDYNPLPSMRPLRRGDW